MLEKIREKGKSQSVVCSLFFRPFRAFFRIFQSPFFVFFLSVSHNNAVIARLRNGRATFAGLRVRGWKSNEPKRKIKTQTLRKKIDPKNKSKIARGDVMNSFTKITLKFCCNKSCAANPNTRRTLQRPLICLHGSNRFNSLTKGTRNTVCTNT